MLHDTRPSALANTAPQASPGPFPSSERLGQDRSLLLVSLANRLENTRYFFFSFLFGLITFYLVFSAALLFPYDQLDQLRLFAYPFDTAHSTPVCLRRDVLTYHLLTGRPLQVFYECVEHAYVSSLRDLFLFRLIDVIVLSLCVGIMALFLRRLLSNGLTALFLSCAIFLLPSYQFLVTIGSVGLSVLLPIMMVSVAYLLLPEPESSPSKPERNRISVFVRVGFSSLAIFFAACSYQTTVFYFFIFTAARVLFSSLSQWKETRSYVIRDLYFIVTCSAIYFVTVKLAAWVFLDANTISKFDPGLYKLSFNWDLLNKLHFFLMHHVPNSLRLWTLYGEQWIAEAAAFLIVLGLGIKIALSLRSYYRHEPLKHLLPAGQAGFVLIGLAIAVNTPWIVSSSVGDAPHMFFSLATIMVLVLWTSISEFPRLIPGITLNGKTAISISLSVALMGYAIIIASANVSLSVLNASLELSHFKSEIAKHLASGSSSVSRIHVIRATGPNGYNALPRLYSEFNEMSMAINPAHVMEMAGLILTELVHPNNLKPITIVDCRNSDQCVDDHTNSSQTNELIVSQSEPGEPIHTTPNMIIVDMHALARANGVEKFHLKVSE